MTSDVLIALIIAIPPTLAALGGIFATLWSDRRGTKKLDHITVLTNSTLTAAMKRIEDLEKVVLRQQTELIVAKTE